MQWHWHTEPELIGGLLLFAWLYGLAVWPFRGKIAPEAPFPSRHVICFYSGLVLFYLTVGSPLDQLGEDYLLTAHMVQHILLIHPVPILILLGIPPWLVKPVFRIPFLRSLGAFLVHPVSAGFLFTLTLYLWHLPELYDLALRVRWIHNLEHVSFFASALLVWTVLLCPFPELPWRSYPVRILFFFLLGVAQTPLFAFITFAPFVLYPTYEYAPRIVELSPHEDQVLAGIFMKLAGMLIAIGVCGWFFYRWFKESEQADNDKITREA